MRFYKWKGVTIQLPVKSEPCHNGFRGILLLLFAFSECFALVCCCYCGGGVFFYMFFL